MVTVLPIVLLSHDMAALLDGGLGRLGAPAPLAGVLIAVIVFLPEALASVRAALSGEVQRVSNLCHGVLVSTVGLTIPIVLIIGRLTGQNVILAESPANLPMLGVTRLLSVATFAARKVTATHGAAHLSCSLPTGSPCSADSTNLLTRMRRAGTIHNAGSRQKPRWALV